MIIVGVMHLDSILYARNVAMTKEIMYKVLQHVPFVFV